jgi:hypothetical protein
MSEYLDRAKLYHVEIRRILLQDWDPIGVSHVPEAQDEYDSYVGEIHGMLIRHEAKHKLFDHLWWIETKHMCLFGSWRRTNRVVDNLIRLREHIESGQLTKCST